MTNAVTIHNHDGIAVLLVDNPPVGLVKVRLMVCVLHSLPRRNRQLGRESAPLDQRGRASLFVNFAGDEMALLDCNGCGPGRELS